MPDTRDRFQFGDFILDLATYKLLRRGHALPIEPKALDLLRLLIEHAPRVVDKTEIFAHIWKDVAVTDNALTRVVAQLRKVLDDDARTPRYIETIATRGYRFIAGVEAVHSAPADVPSVAGLPSAPPAARDRGASLAGRTKWAALALTAVTAILLAATVPIERLVFLDWTGATREARSDAHDIERLAALTPRQVTAGKGYDGFLAFSPDGTSIAYSSDRSGAFEIYVEGRAPGSTAAALTNNGRQNVQPAWSPDGRFVAYHEMAGNGIWIVPSRGGAARRVSDFGAHPSWSPDGRCIAFQSLPVNDINPLVVPGSPSTVWTVDVTGGQPTAVTRPGDPPGPHLSPAWAPDSRRVFFVSSTAGQDTKATGLFVADIEAGTTRLIAVDERLTPEFILAPPMRGVYFIARGTNALWWLPFDETGRAEGESRPTGISTVGSRAAQPAISPDGRQLAWTGIDSTGHLWVARVDRADPRSSHPAGPLTEGHGVRYSLPAASTDGRLAFVGARSGTSTGLFLRTPDGVTRQLTTDEAFHSGPQWMPGERELAFFSDHDGTLGFRAVDTETGRERPLFVLSDLPQPPRSQLSTLSPTTNVVLAPDFSRLAVSVVQDAVPNLWIVTLQQGRPAGDPVQRTFEREGGTYPVWSPDGRWIAYQCHEGTDTHVCVVAADGGERHRLTREPGQSWVGGWMDDSDTILFAARRSAVWNVASVARTAGAARTLTTFTEPRGYVRYPRWDQANRRIVFERSDAWGRIWLVELP
jgi:Tol biopolymer transport system component/DNA-binding winged helix-turn-helix (wHTH) protein